MNILTTNGLVGRYVTDWSGPRSRLAEVNIRLGAPNYPDCTMTLTGSVTEKGALTDDGAYGAVTVSLRGANNLGDHVTGTVTVLLPALDRAGAGRSSMATTPTLLLGQDRHRRHRRHRVLQGLGPLGAAAGRRGGRRRAGRRRHRPVRGAGHGDVQLGHQSRHRHLAQPGHRRPDLLQPHPLRRRRGLRHHSAGGAGGLLGRGRRGRLLPRLQRALGQPLRRRRAGAAAAAHGGERAHGVVPPGRPAHPGLVGGHGGAALPARDRRDERGPRPGGRGRPQARGDQPEGLVLRAADHAGGPPGQPLHRGAAAPARLLPGDRRGTGARGHLPRARPRPAATTPSSSAPPPRARAQART